MKIKVDDKKIFELSETQKKVIQNDISSEIFEADCARRVSYILQHKYERCMERLEKEWAPKLRERVASVPTNRDELADLIFSQPDYKDRAVREAEAKEKEEKAQKP